MIKIFSLEEKSVQKDEKDTNEMKELIHRNSVLLEEKIRLKEECEELGANLSEKDHLYEEEKELNAILSMRINYMITKKFLNDVTKVLDEVEDKQLNDAFDAIIDAANANLDAPLYDFDD